MKARKFDAVQTEAADIDGSGEVDIADLAYFKQYVCKDQSVLSKLRIKWFVEEEKEKSEELEVTIFQTLAIEIIVFWLPKMQDNEYNLISFQTDNYEDAAKLDITPKPDCIQRVFMTFKPLEKYEEVPEQKLEPFTRHGFSVIEWGGTEIGESEINVY